jgi:hypothetical protein
VRHEIGKERRAAFAADLDGAGSEPAIDPSTSSISAWQRLRSAPEPGEVLSRSKSISGLGVIWNPVK